MSGGSTYIVTGGAGFVGSNLVAELYRRDPRADVRVVDDFRSGSFENLVSACERAGVGPFRGSVIPESSADVNLAGAVEVIEPRAVFHLGAITDTTLGDERSMIRSNTEGFEELIDACGDAGVPLVYASSATTFGTPPQARRREAFPESAAGRPSNVYGFSKWLMECAHRRVAARREAEGEPAPRCVGLRYFNVFGPGESHKGPMASMVHQLAERMLAGERPRLFTAGEQARDQVPVEDVVDGTLAAAGLGERDPGSIEPGVYNLGSGVATTFNAVVEALRNALGVSAAELPTEYFDMPESVRAFYQDWTLADMSAAEAGLGWRPSRDPAAAISDYAERLASRARGAAGTPTPAGG